jgi:hypothetical protein
LLLLVEAATVIKSSGGSVSVPKQCRSGGKVTFSAALFLAL